MESQLKILGRAKRVRVRLPFSAIRQAWDCRPFGFGRIIAPMTTGSIEIAPRVELDLATGEIRAEVTSQKRLA